MTETPIPTHAGGIVVRHTPAGVRYLLVRARRQPGLWVFPKGRIEPGESPGEAAVREVYEEAGATARVSGPAGTLTMPAGQVTLFVMDLETEAPSPEGREAQWFAYEDASRALAFPESRDLLARIHQRLTDDRS